MQHEDYVKTQWWLHNLLVTDRKIVGRKRREVQLLINKYANESDDQKENPLAVVPRPRRISFVDEISSTPLASSENQHHEPFVRRGPLTWELSTWPQMECFYHQMTLAMGSLTNGELAFAMCNPTKQIKFDLRDIEKQRELEEELRDWLPKVGSHILESKNSFEKYYGASSVKPIIRNKENIVWGPAYRHLDVKTLRTVMEHELAELGMTRLHKVVCNSCAHYYPANLLYLVKNNEQSVSKCISCWESWKSPLPPKTLFDFLIVGIADKWAELVGRRVQYLYGEWDERLTPMVKMLKENVLLAEDIAMLLRTCNDPEEFMDACEVVICTTMVFYLEYVDFRRSCEALIKLKPNVTYNQLFQIFAIYFPNRAKGVKTGDFL